MISVSSRQLYISSSDPDCLAPGSGDKGDDQSPLTKEKQVCDDNQHVVGCFIFLKMPPNLGKIRMRKICWSKKHAVEEHFVVGFLRRNHCVLLPLVCTAGPWCGGGGLVPRPGLAGVTVVLVVVVVGGQAGLCWCALCAGSRRDESVLGSPSPLGSHQSDSVNTRLTGSVVQL